MWTSSRNFSITERVAVMVVVVLLLLPALLIFSLK